MDPPFCPRECIICKIPFLLATEQHFLSVEVLQDLDMLKYKFLEASKKGKQKAKLRRKNADDNGNIAMRTKNRMKLVTKEIRCKV